MSALPLQTLSRSRNESGSCSDGLPKNDQVTIEPYYYKAAFARTYPKIAMA